MRMAYDSADATQDGLPGKYQNRQPQQGQFGSPIVKICKDVEVAASSLLGTYISPTSRHF